jgi:hypothetical protein
MLVKHNVTLELATEGDATLLANLLELYIHDLSEVFHIELGVDGRFGYGSLPLYWSKPETHFAFLFRLNSRIAGFALVARGSPATSDSQDLDLAEFFVPTAAPASAGSLRLYSLTTFQGIGLCGSQKQTALPFPSGRVRFHATPTAPLQRRCIQESITCFMCTHSGVPIKVRTAGLPATPLYLYNRNGHASQLPPNNSFKRTAAMVCATIMRRSAGTA